MPLLLEQNTPHNGILGIWRIKESEGYFMKRLVLSKREQRDLDKIKGQGRRVQWLSVRYLLHHLSGRPQRMELIKDSAGKPHLPDSKFHISISHSHQMAAVLASPVSCGVDIQLPVEKIKRLVPRFCNKLEISQIPSSNELDAMHVLWGAKECMYKAFGRRAVDYREHLEIPDAAALFNRSGEGTLKKENTSLRYDILAEHVLDYILTYCFEIE